MDRKKKTYGFEIPTPSRTFYLAAESETERSGWIDAIENTKTALNKSKAVVCGE